LDSEVGFEEYSQNKVLESTAKLRFSLLTKAYLATQRLKLFPSQLESQVGCLLYMLFVKAFDEIFTKKNKKS
jgi:hypothetical protein